MSERQSHGFAFENRVKSLLGVTEEKSYTSKWDIGSNISVKFISSTGTVDMGSAVRIYESLENPGWKMILGRHVDKVCVDVFELEFTPEICEKLKGDFTSRDILAFDEAIKSFEVGRHVEAREFAKLWKAHMKKRMGLLTIQPKIDSRSQRRVQCGINRTNLQKLFNLTTSETFKSLIGENFAV